MPITLGLNIASLSARRQLDRTSGELETVFTRLSSGQRINSAGDDAAGLAIADSLNADSRVFTQGVRNLNDGLSILNVADGALQELTSITLRLTELAEQAANGSYSNTQREALDAEAQALSDEYFRIAKSTEFNGQKLFEADYGTLSLQAGYGTDGRIANGLGGDIGDGTFTDRTSFITHTINSRAVASADFNSDGILDIVSAGRSASGEITIYIGDGSGNLTEGASYSTETFGSLDMDIGDVNNDGIIDIVTVGSSGTGEGTVFLGQGDGTFTEFATFAAVSTVNAYSVELGDLNGDGILDAVTGGTGNEARVFLGQGDGSFTDIGSFSSGITISYDIAIQDINGDGLADVVMAGSAGGSIFFGQGDGSLSLQSAFATESSGSYAVELGDINNDGVIDLITAGDDGPGEVTVFLGDGDGTFTEIDTYNTELFRTYGLAIGDLNGDGFIDLVTAGQSSAGEATVLFGNGDGTFVEQTTLATEATESRAVTLTDLDGDGVLDIVTVGENSGDGELSIKIANTVDGVAPLLDFTLNTMAGARQALSQFAQKLDQLSKQRGEIGAFQSRVEVAENVLQVTAENYKAAESRIRDADIAQESARLVRLQILQQSSAAVLAQANSQPSLVLELLAED